MTNSTYNGVGYTSDPAFTIQDFLGSRYAAAPLESITTNLNAELTTLGAPAGTLSTFLATFSQNNILPQNIDSFISALVAAVPSFTVATQGAALKSNILSTIKANLSIEDPSYDQSTIAAALNDPSLQPNSSTFYSDVYSSAFNFFVKNFNYTAATVNGTTPTVTAGVSYINSNFFDDSFKDFFFRFATVVNPTDSSVNFQQIYDAFFGTNNPNFTKFLANYIQSVLYPAPGQVGTFLPNENIGDWMQKVQQSYSSALYGSAAPTTSSVGQSFKKIVIIDQVLRLIIKMIGTLQKVAAVQSDRLRILTLQQSAYTTMMTQVPVFTQGDGTIFGSTTITSKTESQKAQDQGNNYNQTLTETIRSRRTTVQDDAKTLQSNINQSNDSANEQSSTATALLQTLSTLLAAIFR